MEFKGTKGEWKLETVKDDISGEVSEIYITQEGGGCIVCINDGDDNYDIPTDLANAQLISASPELLAFRYTRIDDDKITNHSPQFSQIGVKRTFHKGYSAGKLNEFIYENVLLQFNQ